MGLRTINRKKITVTIAAGPTATPISATSIFPTDISIHFPSANTSSVGYIGNSTVDATWIPRAKGETYNLVHGDGNMDSSGSGTVLGMDLSKLYVFTGTAGDTCIVEYFDFQTT